MPTSQRRSRWTWIYIPTAVLVAVLVYLAATEFAVGGVAEFLVGRRQGLYTVIVSVNVTMLGFVLATLTVVLGYAQSPRFQVLRDSSSWSALFSVFTTALWAFAIAFSAALAGLLIDRDSSPQPSLTSLVAGATVAALAALLHLLVVLRRVVQVVIVNPSRPPGA